MGLKYGSIIAVVCGIFLCVVVIPITEAHQTEWECSMEVSEEMKKAAKVCFEKYPIEVHNETAYFKDRKGMNFTETEMNNFICIMKELGVIADPDKPVFDFDKMLAHVKKFQCEQKEKDGITTIVTECRTEVDEVVPDHNRLRIEGILRCFVFKFHQSRDWFNVPALFSRQTQASQKDICGKPKEGKEA